MYWPQQAFTTLNQTIFRVDSELLDERSKPGEGANKWVSETPYFTGNLLFGFRIGD
ncbi:MAG TPA: hypothetical protein VIK29_08685 [Paludibacter sp.]